MSDWISIEERLPELVRNSAFSKRVLMYGIREDQSEPNYHTGIVTKSGKWLSYGKEVGITHWQPLPNPPQN